MSKGKVLLVGCGDIGIPLGLRLRQQGFDVWGLRRNPQDLPTEISAVAADVCEPRSLAVLSNHSFDYIVVTLTPAGFSDEGYRRVFVEGLGNVQAAVASDCVKRWFFVSSTSVYHQGEGQWVDEESDTHPETFSGQRLLEAENLLLGPAATSVATVVRFAGIYGPGRRRLISQVQNLQGCAQTPELMTNRIHRDDCVGFLEHLLLMDSRGETPKSLYIGVDNEPVSMWTLKRWLAQQLDLDPDSLQPTATTRRNSKRCRNQRLHDSGYCLRYPSYREGYSELLASAE